LVFMNVVILFFVLTLLVWIPASLIPASDVKSSRPKWPRGSKILASASKLWPRPRPRPRPRSFGLGLASIWLSYYVIGHYSCKNRVKFGNFVNFSGNNLESYVVNHYLVLFLGLGLDLIVLASASASKLWPRLRPRHRPRGLASFNITDSCTVQTHCF